MFQNIASVNLPFYSPAKICFYPGVAHHQQCHKPSSLHPFGEPSKGSRLSQHTWTNGPRPSQQQRYPSEHV